MKATMLLYCVLFYAVLINFWGFFLIIIDKRKSQLSKWRIPEATLFLVAALGGSAGTYLGMQFMRHKTQHRIFRFGIPLLFFLQIALLSYLFLSAR